MISFQIKRMRRTVVWTAIWRSFCHLCAMDDTIYGNGLTNCEGLNVYNELVRKKWR